MKTTYKIVTSKQVVLEMTPTDVEQALYQYARSHGYDPVGNGQINVYKGAGGRTFATMQLNYTK
jgi:hypothetical protein